MSDQSIDTHILRVHKDGSVDTIPKTQEMLDWEDDMRKFVPSTKKARERYQQLQNRKPDDGIIFL